MAKWIRNGLGIVIIAFLSWYLARHWQNIRVLVRLKPAELLIMYFICFLGLLNSALVVQRLLRSLQVKTFFWDMVLLQNATYLLNYVPMKFGTFFRANYLKRHYGLSYAHFGTFFVYLVLLMAGTASAVGLAVLVAIYGIAGYEKKVLLIAFMCVLVFSVSFAFIPLPIPFGSGKLSTIVRNFLSGRRDVARNKHTLTVCTVLLVGNFALASARLGIIYSSMGQGIHPAGYLVLGALGFVIMFVSLTPGSLGIRELVLGSGATVLGIPLEVGILAAMIDRAIAISWTFVVGGACTVWLWHKSPADFRQTHPAS